MSLMESSANTRVNWLDVARIIGIFCIYLGHFQYYAGYSYDFVFRFHVPLFFFLAGCAENFNTRAIIPGILHKIKTVLIPFYFFGILSIIVDCLVRDSYSYLKEKCIKLLLGAGREDGFVAYQLWFLSSIFISYLLFYLIKWLLRKRILILLAGVVIFFAGDVFFHQLPSFYNIDYAVAYFHFFLIGYLVFPFLDKWFGKSELVILNIVKLIIFFSCLGLTILLFFRIDRERGWVTLPLENELVIIYVIIGVSYFIGLLAENKTFSYGADTMYLCGNEYMIKALFPFFISLFGLNIVTEDPMQCYFYTLVLFAVQHRFVIPAEKALIREIQGLLSKIN